jgi:hypothetical protein
MTPSNPYCYSPQLPSHTFSHIYTIILARATANSQGSSSVVNYDIQADLADFFYIFEDLQPRVYHIHRSLNGVAHICAPATSCTSTLLRTFRKSSTNISLRSAPMTQWHGRFGGHTVLVAKEFFLPCKKRSTSSPVLSSSAATWWHKRRRPQAVSECV